MKLSERIKGCLAVEAKAIEIYKELAGCFPIEVLLWKQLARAEENHYAVLVVARGYDKSGKMPEEIAPEMSCIVKTLRDGEEILRRLRARDISLEEVMGMLIELEQDTAEGYFQDVMQKETDVEVIARLQELITDEKRHAESIRERMISRGFLEGTGGKAP